MSAVGRAKTRIKKASAPAPLSRVEVNQYISQIGEKQRELDSIEAEISAATARHEAEVAKRVETLRKDRGNLLNGLFAWAQQNRSRLIREARGGKTIGFTTGTIAWRYTPPAVNVENDEELIKALHKLGLLGYVRIKEELDREALLRDRKKIKISGVGFSQREEFVVTPHDHKREVKKTRTIKLS